MIGGGGKIGGPPGGGPIVSAPPTTGETAKPDAPAGKAAPAAKGDSFEKGNTQAKAPQPMGAEQSGSADVLKMARDNPTGAKALVANMAAQAQKNVSSVATEKAGAEAALQQLAAQKFSKKALKEKAKELKKKRDKIAAMKMRLGLTTRKMALLQQLAGKLGDPDLEEELDRILGNHEKLQTDWGRQHHLLSIAETFYGGDDDTPEHLRDVVRADVKAGLGGDIVGQSMQAVSPRRVLAEIIARTLDGSTYQPESDDTMETVGAKGEHGKTLQSWSELGTVMADSLTRDPFDDPDPTDA